MNNQNKNLNNILLINSLDDTNVIYSKLIESIQDTPIYKELEEIEDIDQLHSFITI